MMEVIGALTVLAVVVVMVATAPRSGRPGYLTPRQERKWERLAELDEARAALLEELGIEPTAAELWMASPPKIEGEDK